MTEQIKLSVLVDEIQETIQNRFEGEVFWVTAQITNVKKYESNRRCYLTLEEYDNGEKKAELKAVFWSNYYTEIEKFEKQSGQLFKNGIEITCKLKIRFHAVYGLNADVVQVYVAHTLGSLALQKQQTLANLLKENPTTIQLFDGRYFTFNNRLPLPLVIKKIALITAPNSDGQRDFLEEITKNKHNFNFEIHQYLCTIQGENAHKLIFDQLKSIEQSFEAFDAVAIVRGGGSQSDFKPFDDYDLANLVANFPIPIFTGIGHDSNQSIVDLMAREQKTPTKVAALFVEHNFEFENKLMDLKTSFFDLIKRQTEEAKNNLEYAKRMVKMASPEAILNRGFAIVMQENKIITQAEFLDPNQNLQTFLRGTLISSKILKQEKNEKGIELQ